MGYICEVRNNYSGCSDIHEAVIYAQNNLAKMLSCFTISICRDGYSELPEITDLEQMHHFVCLDNVCIYSSSNTQSENYLASLDPYQNPIGG